VMIGSGTLDETAADHLFTGEHIYPKAAELYRNYRREVLGKASPPETVVVSASGVLNLGRAVFRTPGMRARILTTAVGGERLRAAGVERLSTTEVRVLSDAGALLAPAAMLEDLRAGAGAGLLLHEGGPTLFGQFVSAGLVDEFFLTLAPQIAGRNPEHPRPAMVSGIEFSPESAPWLRIVSVKQGGDHLYLRYARNW
jgi:riboflavin biosynthesis pyrimidine reductase